MNLIQIDLSLIVFQMNLIQIDLSLIDLICNQFWKFYFFKSFEKTKYNFNNVNIWKNNT